MLYLKSAATSEPRVFWGGIQGVGERWESISEQTEDSADSKCKFEQSYFLRGVTTTNYLITKSNLPHIVYQAYLSEPLWRNERDSWVMVMSWWWRLFCCFATLVRWQCCCRRRLTVWCTILEFYQEGNYTSLWPSIAWHTDFLMLNA